MDGGTALRVFITSTTSHGDFGGLAGADSRCQDRALAVGMGMNWKAWISTTTVNAKDRVLGAGPWVDNGMTLCLEAAVVRVGDGAVD